MSFVSDDYNLSDLFQTPQWHTSEVYSYLHTFPPVEFTVTFQIQYWLDSQQLSGYNGQLNTTDGVNAFLDSLPWYINIDFATGQSMTTMYYHTFGIHPNFTSTAFYGPANIDLVSAFL